MQAVKNCTFKPKKEKNRKKIFKLFSALEQDLNLAHQDPIAFWQRLKFREMDLKYAKSAKGRQRNYKRRVIELVDNEKYSDSDLWQRLVLFEGKCAYCRCFVFSQEHYLTWDHIQALAQGGRDRIENIVPCCRTCNSSKRDCPVYDWFVKQPFFCKESWQKLERLTK